ncbi:nidogen-1-like [Garra rufa]|uniref:nidogen-1-like n=1 Tax=Garra rufa TaxID=137080 RepID=UPI003CCEE025
MECGKAPGVDGLSVDFYKSFWPDVGPDLLEVLKESLAYGRLPTSCRRAILTLLPKKGDLNDIKNWRPINTNGFVALEKPTEETEYLGNMPASFGMIAALQGDLDTSDGVGKVFFRQDSCPALLQQAAEHINRAFPEDDVVNPVHAVVVTWVDVASHHSESRGNGLEHKEERNTFQLVIVSLETMSYAIFLYPRETMQFQSTGRNYTMHAGFSKGQKQELYNHITDDTEASVKNLAEKTNSGMRGVWLFKIGALPDFTGISPGKVPDLPLDSNQDSNTGNHIHQHPVCPHSQHETDVFTCNSGECGGQKCSKFGECRDYPRGCCCQCKPGYYGNGVQCAPDGIPQSIKVRGNVSVGNSSVPVDFASNDLHSYVMVNDRTANVDIIGFPPIVGSSLQPLSSVGEIIGWMFALQQLVFSNGFNITGGVSRRQVDVTFLPGGERLTLSQEFKDIDENDHPIVDIRLKGMIPEGATVPYKEIYKYSTNWITSSSRRMEYEIILLDRFNRRRSYKFRETITFQGCQHDKAIGAVPSTQRRRGLVSVEYDGIKLLLQFFF